MKTDAEILNALDAGKIGLSDLWLPYQTGPKPGSWHWYEKAYHSGWTPAENCRAAASRLIEANEVAVISATHAP